MDPLSEWRSHIHTWLTTTPTSIEAVMREFPLEKKPVLFTVETCPWCKGEGCLVVAIVHGAKLMKSCTVCEWSGKIRVWGDRAHDAR